jgi:transcriptional regulator with XRE-family HTH domain
MKTKDPAWESLTYEQKLAQTRSSFEYHLEGFRSDLTEQIFLALERSGLSRTDFAAKLGVTKGRITQLLDGSNNFTLETLARISDVLQAELRLTLRPRGWEQVREYTKPSFDPRVVARDVVWTTGKTLQFSGRSSAGSQTKKVPDDVFSSAA